jgi:ATP-dependent Clp protease ATP-binding subunit ClpA
MPMISTKLKKYIKSACAYAKGTNARHTTLVHILLSILDDEQFQHALKACGVNYLDVRQSAVEAITSNMEREARTETGERPEGDRLTSHATYVFHGAFLKAQGHGFAEAGVLDCAAAMLEIHDNGSFDYKARDILTQAGLTGAALAKVYREVEGMTGSAESADAADAEDDGLPRAFVVRDIEGGLPGIAEFRETLHRMTGRQPPKQQPIVDALALYTTDLTLRARNGQLDRSHDREGLLSDLEIVLSRRKKSNAILIGEPGVGKTSVVEELACRVVEGTVSGNLVNAQLLSLDLGALVGGTRFRGDLEERLNAIISELKADQRKILFVDEIHTLVSPSHSASVAADLLKPALASGEIRCIGATTLSEYKRYFEADGAMSRRFVPLFVSEPSRDEAVAILMKSAAEWGKFYGVEFTRETVEKVVDHSIRHVPERHLPDKAIDLIDDLGARAMVSGVVEIDDGMIEKSVAAVSGRSLAKCDRVTIESAMNAAVYGQMDAVSSIAAAVTRNIKGVGGVRTVALVGPQGCGKKHAAKALADALGVQMKTVKLADFSEPASVTRLIGAPPGYIGFDSGGLLYDLAKRNPGAVLLFQNAERAHPSVLDLLEDTFAEGVAREATGRVAPLTGSHIVITYDTPDTARAIGFASGADDEHVETGVGLVDGAGSVVTFDKPGSDVIREFLKASLVRIGATAGAMGGRLSIIDEPAVVKSLAAVTPTLEGASKSFKRLVETPVLDYLVSGSGVLCLRIEDNKVRVCEYEDVEKV